MTDTRTDEPMVSELFPIVSTRDVGRALGFYRDSLGGTVSYEFPAPDWRAVCCLGSPLRTRRGWRPAAILSDLRRTLSSHGIEIETGEDYWEPGSENRERTRSRTD